MEIARKSLPKMMFQPVQNTNTVEKWLYLFHGQLKLMEFKSINQQNQQDLRNTMVFFFVVEWILKDAAKTEASPFRVTNSMVQLAGAARGSSIRRTFRHPRHQTGPLQGENLGLIDSDRIKLNTEYKNSKSIRNCYDFLGQTWVPSHRVA